MEKAHIWGPEGPQFSSQSFLSFLDLFLLFVLPVLTPTPRSWNRPWPEAVVGAGGGTETPSLHRASSLHPAADP